MSSGSYKVVVVDCMNLAHRNWWHRKDLRTSAGVHSGMEHGFLSGVLNLVGKYPDAAIFLVWDGEPLRCREIFPEYKLHRQPLKERALEADWVPRIQMLRDCLAPVFITVYHPGTEADDEIARITWDHDDLRIWTLIFSNDKDTHQLVTDLVHVCPFEKDGQGDDMVYDYPLMRARWGVSPERIPLYRSLLGTSDASDGIRGISRFPRKLALQMANQCESLDQMLDLMRGGFEETLTVTQKQKLRDPNHQDLVARNYRLMELTSQRGQEIHFLPAPTADLTRIWDLCHKLEFQSLIDRPEWHLLGEWPGAHHVSERVSASRSPGTGEV